MENAKKETQTRRNPAFCAQNAPVPRYEDGFKAESDYISTLPDVQNADKNSISGANVPIMQVGMHNFKMPLKFLTKDCEVREAEASVTATVSLAADSKGINMSRIMRVFYLFADRVFTPDLLEEVLVKMKEQIDAEYAAGRNSIMGDDELDNMIRQLDRARHRKFVAFGGSK